MTEAFFLGIGTGVILGLFIYWAFLTSLHYKAAAIVVTEIVLQRIEGAALRRGGLYLKNIQGLIDDAMAGFLDIDNKGFSFSRPRMLLDSIHERQVKLFGGFFKTMMVVIGVKHESFTGKR